MLFNRRKLLYDRKLLGQWGEKRCEKFLARKGLKTLIRNFSCKTGEIDLVMVDTDGSIVFVEVRTKTRRSEKTFGSPEDSITYPKKVKLSSAASHFLATHKIEDRPFRFDVVSIVLGRTGRPQIRHYENAFIP
jgi:putative endonuclease